MATLKAVVRTARADGFYPVYIRVTHHRASSFIKTDKMVTKKELTKNNEIKDPFVLQYCSKRILEYNERLNQKDIEHWTAKEIAEYLTSGNDDICFSEYARLHISRMIDNGQERNAKNYQLALQHLERFCGTSKVMFSHFTSQLMNRWIKSLESTHRAKEMYPICMRQVFKAAQLEYNDYDTGLIRIKTNPWVKVEIPAADKAEKLAITPEACRAFFSFPIPDSKMKFPLTEFGRDIAMMVLCLAGINTVDLYNLRKKDYENGIIRYQRAKTRKSRTDGAYMEMRVPAIIQPLFDKYIDTTEDEHLFNFYQRMGTSDSFNANANSGIKQICKAMELPKEDYYSIYTFRHTWGTVAQNDVRASIADVAFAMNHSSGHTVTRGYIKIDACAILPLVAKERNVIKRTRASIRIFRRISQSVHSVYSCKYAARSAAARLYSLSLEISTYKSTRVLSGNCGSTFAFSRRIIQVSYNCFERTDRGTAGTAVLSLGSVQ